MTHRVAGIDDAGRGPVIGPLIVAGAVIDDSRLEQLAKAGVRDSKLLEPQQRSLLANQIVGLVDEHCYVQISPIEIDEVVGSAPKYRRLNYVEAQAMARTISKLAPQIAYVDASDVNPHRFRQQIVDALAPKLKGIEIVSEHHADSKYPVVSAASILAKVRRDEEVRKLRERFGDFGSGYPSDPRTTRFLRDYWLKNRSFPPIVRKSWKTIKKLESELSQMKL